MYLGDKTNTLVVSSIHISTVSRVASRRAFRNVHHFFSSTQTVRPIVGSIQLSLRSHYSQLFDSPRKPYGDLLHVLHPSRSASLVPIGPQLVQKGYTEVRNKCLIESAYGFAILRSILIPSHCLVSLYSILAPSILLKYSVYVLFPDCQTYSVIVLLQIIHNSCGLTLVLVAFRLWPVTETRPLYGELVRLWRRRRRRCCLAIGLFISLRSPKDA